MKFFRFLTHTIHLRPFSKLRSIIQNFSITEKVIFFVAVFVFIFSGLILLLQVNNSYLSTVPTHGGTIEEGIIGTPRFINPILALSESDKDLTSLVYAGLLSVDTDGSYIPDLAQSYTISEDGTTYTFTLKDNLTFHDGTPLTTEDIAFTISMAQDITLKSPRRASWTGVVVQTLSPTEIAFILPEQYEPFIENFTLGILPKHIWKNVTSEQFQFSQFNVKPVGSGPYRIDSVRFNESGLPTEYELEPFKDYALGKPYISHFILHIYQSEQEVIDAFNKGDIDSLRSISKDGLSQLEISKKNKLYTSPLPRVFGLFFNQDEAPVFLESEVREALLLSLDKEHLVDTIFGNTAKPIHSAVPTIAGEFTYSIDEATATLNEHGWVKNEETGIYEKENDEGIVRLRFSISTSNTPEIVQVAEEMKRQWNNFGADVSVRIFETNALNQDVIRPRSYDSLLFGEIIGRGTDLYPFWHSSGRTDPGLNIALYTNITVDKLLEDARVSFDTTKKQELLSLVHDEIQKDIPALFVYSPYFTYVLPEKIQNVHIDDIVLPSDRFNQIQTWYIETERIWNIFIH